MRREGHSRMLTPDGEPLSARVFHAPNRSVVTAVVAGCCLLGPTVVTPAESGPALDPA